MRQIRFYLVGGFLGAGKTTLLARLARHFMDQNLRVGLVTNDQAQGLVDTRSLEAQGFRVGEVPGACFCCKFDDLVATAAALEADQQPDVILAEPVGSCTDLVATVVRPLRQLYGERYSVGPMTVLLKPEHGRRILGARAGTGFSPKAEYIFLKQIEEADLVVVNKIDKLSAEQVRELVDQVQQRFPRHRVLQLSAKTGAGLDELTEALVATPVSSSLLEIDYDTYAQGEAELGWLNCSATITGSATAFPLDRLLLDLVGAIAATLQQRSAEAAHLKVFAQGGDGWGVANLVASGQPGELSQPSQVTTTTADILVNARVAIDPVELAELVQQALARVAGDVGGDVSLHDVQQLRPGRPVPTHRLAAD